MSQELLPERRPEDAITLILEGLEFYAYHGVPAEEQVVGHRYSIDLELILNAPAVRTDDVHDTVDYGDLAIWLVSYCQKSQFATLERLAGAAADGLLDRYPRLDALTIRVAKRLPPAPVILGSAAAQISRQRG